MEKKKFPCKLEELPVIAGFILQSVRKDLADFSGFSSMFTVDFIEAGEMKVNACNNLLMSSSVAKQLKAVTQNLADKSVGLRVKLNQLEGYLKLAAGEIDIKVSDSGLKEVRNDISRGNTEGVVKNTWNLVNNAQRNQPALVAKGLKTTFLAEITTAVTEIDSLNNTQNVLTSERNRLTDSNMSVFNDVWTELTPILDTAKALYRGVDDVKLKDYTMSQLVKRVNAEGSRMIKPAKVQA